MISAYIFPVLGRMPKPPAKDSKAVALGEWLQQQRLSRGLKRPEAVQLALQHDPRAALSPDYLSKLEYGVRSLAAAALDIREALRLGLNISASDWEEATGLATAQVAPEPAPRRLTPPARTRQLPQPLQDAIDIYGKRFEDLRDPKWQQYLASFNWREGQPDDPEAWLDLYRDLTRAGVVPGED